MHRLESDGRFRILHQLSCLFGALLAVGCVHTGSELRDSPERRILPVADRERPVDTMVRPAVASQRGQGAEAHSEGDRAASLPPAIEAARPAGNHDRSSSPAPALPRDSDEAALDAIAASGKPLTLAEAADIRAARPNGARSDASMSDDERAAFKNAIWLCASCHTIIDTNQCADFSTDDTGDDSHTLA
jgi:hypothetical protein